MLEGKLLLILDKLILGIMLAAPIGPVSVEMIRRGINKGFMAAFSIRLGGAIGNFLCLVGAYFGLSQIMKYPVLINSLGLIGAGLLIYMGVTSILKKALDLDLEDRGNLNNGLTWGFYLAIANPVSLVFWPGVFAAGLDQSIGITFYGFLENLFIIVGVLIWGGGLSLLLGFGHKYLNKKVITMINRISGVAMIFFGCKYLWVIGQRLFA